MKTHENFFRIHALGAEGDISDEMATEDEQQFEEQSKIEQIYQESGGDYSQALDRILETPGDGLEEPGRNLKGKRLKELA